MRLVLNVLRMGQNQMPTPQELNAQAEIQVLRPVDLQFESEAQLPEVSAPIADSLSRVFADDSSTHQADFTGQFPR